MLEIENQLKERVANKSTEEFAQGQDIIRDYLTRKDSQYSKPVIAVAGTNGKGSCVTTLTEVYLKAGYQVGAYISPHLNEVNERFLLNGSPIDQHSLEQTLTTLMDDPSLASLSYFEMLTLCAWELWTKIDPDVIILEVGLGGRLDAVNALPITAGIITSIDFDHTDILGDTLEAISIEKARIARPGMPLVVAEPNMPTEAISVIDQVGSMLYQNGFAYEAHVVDQDFIWSYYNEVLYLPRPKLHHQSVGAALMMVVALNDEIPVDQSCFESALLNAAMPGRFECINEQKQIWVDVAHNVSAVEHLLSRWPFAWEETCCIVAIKNTKDWHGMLKLLMKKPTHVYAVNMSDESMVPAKKITQYMKLDDSFILQENDLASFLNVITEKTLVFGSFHLVNTVRQIGSSQIAWDEPSNTGETDA
ncbi:MAG: hypothetical protein VX835_02730 [Pseudomonadota bacterium]|nr:hypothetical protein [Pseudomonadota bacterium]